jgi:hypothetical protein
VLRTLNTASLCIRDELAPASIDLGHRLRDILASRRAFPQCSLYSCQAIQPPAYGESRTTLLLSGCDSARASESVSRGRHSTIASCDASCSSSNRTAPSMLRQRSKRARKSR